MKKIPQRENEEYYHQQQQPRGKQSDDVIRVLQAQLDSKLGEMRAFIMALNHCCSHVSQVRSVSEARDLLMLLKQVSIRDN